VTYASGPVKSTVDYIIVRQEDRAKIHNVKVIPNEECVPKHKLLVMDMRFNKTKIWCKKFEPRVHVWKLKEETTYAEYQSMVKDKVAETEWKYLDVNEHWQQMKNIMMETVQVSCGLSEGPCRHKETWWNEELAEAVREKKKKVMEIGKKEILTEAWKEYKKSKQNAMRVISLAKGKKQKECESDLNDPNHQNSNSKADGKRKTGYNRVKLSERSIG